MVEEEVPIAKQRNMAPLYVDFGFRPNNKGEPSNVEIAIWKICWKKGPVKKH